MERTNWLTVERTVAPAVGAPARRRSCGDGFLGAFQITPKLGFVLSGHGPGLVGAGGNARVSADHHAAMGLTAWTGTPLGSRGAGDG